MRKYICDNCGEEEASATISRPPGWTNLAIQGYIGGRQSQRIERDFCKDCTDKRFPEGSSTTDIGEELSEVLIEFINETVQEAMENAQC